jgi:hypothetical protein
MPIGSDVLFMSFFYRKVECLTVTSYYFSCARGKGDNRSTIWFSFLVFRDSRDVLRASPKCCNNNNQVLFKCMHTPYSTFQKHYWLLFMYKFFFSYCFCLKIKMMISFSALIGCESCTSHFFFTSLNRDTGKP